MRKKRVVVTGMGIVSCFGSNVHLFYEQLLAKKSGVREITEFDVSKQSTTFAAPVQDFSAENYIAKKQLRRMDPFLQYGIVAGKKALEDAKLFPVEPDEKTGVILGSGMGGMSAFYQGVLAVDNHGYKRLTPFFVPSIISNMAGGMLAIDCGFSGPNYSIATACATASYCLLAGFEAIQNGQATRMLCGGSEAAIHPIGMAGFMSARALSTRNDAPQQASRPWDKNRDGFVMGEGAGVLVLEELERAKLRKAPIYAELLGGFSNCDAYHITNPRPDGIGVMRCLQQALDSSSIPLDQVNYINAHATSTIAGDLCELQAIKSCFGDHTKNILINSTKSMTGHCLGAAGAVEAIATCFAIHTKKVHPNINLENPEPQLQDFVCPTEAQNWNIKVALSNSFGFGGHNCCLVFAPYE